jgi:transposase-like protein
MMMAELGAVGAYCPNEACSDYGKLQRTQVKKHIKKHGHGRNGRQRYRCTTCGKTFTETHGTLFYRRRTPASEIVEVLAMLAEGMRISSVSRVKGHKEDTILSWLREASCHAQEVEEVLLADYPVTRGQVDALWSYVGHKGEKKGMSRPPSTARSGVRP